MAKALAGALRAAAAGAALTLASVIVAAGGAQADQPERAQALGGTPVIAAQNQRVVRGERYRPGISITPDGCEVWVMDDGAEGYAVEHVRRDGTPVCREINVCGVMNTDQFFATDSWHISHAGKQRLREFFQEATAFGYIIVGHTDARASDEYNMRLSYRRANSVAAVALDSGARVIDVRGYGERQPRATNATAEGMAQNRRVEILCVR
ncbi:OmpA family protein [Rhodosalinus halophilus]|uniref:OmpA family protein n=1 Tax=Rhodosalinus halophilus TaxID=2259333 RepID=UPI0026B51FA0